MRWVLDCSVAVKWFVREELSDAAIGLLDGLRRGEVQFVAPDCIVPELGHAFRRLVLGNVLSAADATQSVRDFLDLPIFLAPAGGLAAQAMEIAIAHSATFYDALYLALAIREDLKLVTADTRMTRAFARLDRTVHLADLA